MNLPELKRIDVNDCESIKDAEAEGFACIDTLCTYEMPVINQLDFSIEKAQDDHLLEATSLALMELRGSRLYHDKYIPIKNVFEVYRERVKKAFDRDKVFVAVIEQHEHGKDYVIGFAALRENEIDLIAVSEKYQRQGVGRALVLTCVVQCAQDGHKTVIVKTQDHNEKARTFYHRVGFSMVKEEKEMHRHQCN